MTYTEEDERADRAFLVGVAYGKSITITDEVQNELEELVFDARYNTGRYNIDTIPDNTTIVKDILAILGK